jgi:predicted O-methyltransferase YrrM
LCSVIGLVDHGPPFVDSQAVDDYLRTVVARESPLLQRLREQTSQLPMGGMQIGADQGVFLAFLVRLIGARNAIEVGTFTGYSALSVASALVPGGRLVCCDISEEWTTIARRYWAEAGVADRIELHLQPAQLTLGELLRNNGAGSFDFAFIDADKTGYDAYYEAFAGAHGWTDRDRQCSGAALSPIRPIKSRTPLRCKIDRQDPRRCARRRMPQASATG